MPSSPSSASRWERALATAHWDRRDAVYFEAVRERQTLKEELRDTALTGERTTRALSAAQEELHRLRETMRHRQQQWQMQHVQVQQQHTRSLPLVRPR